MNTFSDLLHYVRVYRRYVGRRMYIVFVLASLMALTQGFGITLLLPLLRASTSSGATGELGTAEQMLYDLLSWMGIANSVYGILVFIALVFFCKGLLQFATKGYHGYLNSEILYELKRRLFDAYTKMSYEYYIQKNTGHFINVINEQATRFRYSFNAFIKFLVNIITAGSYFAFAFLVDWRFAIICLSIGSILLFLFRRLNSYVRNLSRKFSKEKSNLNKLLVESLHAFKYIISTYRFQHLKSNIFDSIDKLRKYIFRQQILKGLTASIKEPLAIIVVIGVIILQIGLFKESISSVFVAVILLYKGLQRLIGVQSTLQRTMERIGALEMVNKEFDNVLESQKSNGEDVIRNFSEGIDFQSVYYAYDESDGDVLEDVDITIPVNTTVALVGESGAGKSTLVDMLTILLRPRSGEVYIDGVPSSKVDLASWRSQVGYVSQETVVFDDTVANNISLWEGDIDEDSTLRERVRSSAEKAHAHHFIQDLPNGYQTVVGDRGVRLSGGQRQRLFVARELFKQPNLLILDEATSALDTQSERYIQDSIDALKGQVTVVIIAHRLSTIKNVDYVYVLDDGRIIEEGSYDELREHGQSRFREMVEMQSL